jgi:hypothetical protein
MDQLNELATQWWRFHRPERREGQHLTDAEYDLMDAADEEVDRLSQEVGSLAQLVAALVERAPDIESIAYVGTWVLEDAEIYVGASGIRQVLSTLDPVAAQRVASGYLPNYGLPDHT